MHVEVEAVDLPLVEPYTIAYDTFTSARNLLVRVVADDGTTGMGASSPELQVTGESQLEIDAAGRAVQDALIGAEVRYRRALVGALAGPLAATPALRAAVDAAMLDLVGRFLEVPSWVLLGPLRPCAPIAVTIGIRPLVETLASAREWLDRGARGLKLKGGLDPDDDITRVRAVRAMAGPHVTLMLDANQGYSLADARRVASALRHDITVFEEPVSEGLEGLGGCGVPVYADESVHSVADVLALQGVDGVNIKLAKCGGAEEALHATAVARARGLGCMVGCMDDCALGIAAALAVVLATPGPMVADLDAHLALAHDPTAGCVRFEDGMLHPSDRPGLGRP